MMVEKQGLSTSRDAVRDPESARAFKDMGFVFVRYFLVLILASTSLAAGVAGFLVWHFGMDVSVEGTGVLEPRGRHLIKSEVNGIIQQIETGQGRRVAAGEQLVVLDSEEWRTDLRKAEKDLEVNRSRGVEIEVRMGRERDILQAEVARARLGVEGAALYLERVRLEQQIYSGDVLLPAGHSRKPLEELVSVRQGVVELQQRQAELRLRQQRLRGVEAGWQEIRTLEKVREILLQDRDLLQHRLERTIICAPVGGTVLTRDLEKRIGDRI